MRFPRHKPHQLPAFLPERRRSSEEGKTIPVPGYRQSRNYSCGFAAALMVARHFAPRTSAVELYRNLGTSRDGTRQTAIVRELRGMGLSANLRYDVDWERTVREIDRGKLLIAYLFDDEHWLVIYGYALGPDRVFVADPRPGHACVHHWDLYGRRLGGFAIVCSSSSRSKRRDTEVPKPIQEPTRLLGPSPSEVVSRQLQLDFVAGND